MTDRKRIEMLKKRLRRLKFKPRKNSIDLISIEYLRDEIALRSRTLMWQDIWKGETESSSHIELKEE
jgi:hypothetical protein